jgi:hypothetical protein
LIKVWNAFHLHEIYSKVLPMREEKESVREGEVVRGREREWTERELKRKHNKIKRGKVSERKEMAELWWNE